MFSNIFFWFVWLFIFTPVLAWILGFVLPIETSTPGDATADAAPASRETVTTPPL